MNNKILVVDDDVAINELIKINLELSGYKVVQAFDGVKGFALAKQELPSLVVLDVMMPEVDGFTVAKRIRQNDETKNIPIIMLTALSQLNDKVNGFNIGVDDYLVKPFEIQELMVRVRALLKRTNQIPQSASTRDLLTLGEITGSHFRRRPRTGRWRSSVRSGHKTRCKHRRRGSLRYQERS